MEIKWTDVDPNTEEKRFLRADRFARKWRFAWRMRRGEQWDCSLMPTLTMWEHVLETLERRYRRRDGVSDEDIADVKVIVADVRRRLAAAGS
jgi:hypothetical protein